MMKYFAEIIETVPEGEIGMSFTLEIQSDSVEDAKTALSPLMGYFTGREYKRYLHRCGNSNDGHNISCRRIDLDVTTEE